MILNSGFRYAETNTGAGVAYRGINRVVALGFPSETICEEKERNLMMRQVMDFFNEQ